MMSYMPGFPPATSLYRRRLLRNSANWGLLGLVGILAILAGWAGVPHLSILIVAGGVLAAVVIDDVTAPTSLIMRFLYWLLYGRPGAPAIPQVSNDQKNLYWCTPFRKRSGEPLSQKRYRWGLFLWIVTAGWLSGLWLGLAGPTDDRMVLRRVALILLIFGSTVIPYGMLVSAIMARFRWGKALSLWLIASTIGPIMLGLSLWMVARDTAVSLPAALLMYLIFLFAYISQRLWIGERAYDRVIQELILKFLSSDDVWESLKVEVPRLIARQMSYPRVFILLATEDNEQLEIVGQYGDNEDVMHKRLPITKGITGRAYSLRETLLWNDTRQCSFYQNVKEPAHVDDTRAEIAIPIRHGDQIYGVLDVQSDVVGVFSTEDTEWLDVIAPLLGAVLAAAESHLLINAAIDSWDQLSSAELASESATFNQFAEAAIPALGAEALVYYPLSPARYPARPPMHSGTEEAVRKGLSYWEPQLMQLVHQWEPSVAASRQRCVIPLGAGSERFGLLAWHFDAPERIDRLKELTIRMLSQGFTTAIALTRYRDIFFDGFGRPELGIHSLLGRHGFKLNDALYTGAMQALETHADCVAARDGKLEACTLFPVLAKTNTFINELIAVETTLPPNFWRTTLQEQLQTLRNSLPRRADGRTPSLELRIDELVERESPWLKLAAYRLAVEAVDNAMHHGAATRISLLIQRTDDTVEIVIRNNGRPIESAAHEKRISARGIYSQLARFRDKYAANVREPAQEGGEVVIYVSIPCLPLVREEI